jgi:hypothetical protein
MSRLLNDQELSELTPSELLGHRTPVPTQVVSSDEFYPPPQNEKQREVEGCLLAMADELGSRQGLDRRAFFRTAAGMAASFLAMNKVYGALFDASAAEASTPELANQRADGLKGQFIMDMHTHFLRDDTRLTRLNGNSRVCADSSMLQTLDRQRRIGHNSTSSSITPAFVMWATIRRKPWRNSSARDGSAGLPI